MSARALTAAGLWLAVAVFGPAPAAGEPAGGSNKSPGGQSAAARSIQMKVFADRATVRRNEAVTVSVWVESKWADPVDVQVFFPEALFTLEGEKSHQVFFNPQGPQNQPTKLPVTFVLTAKQAGKSNIMVRASGTDAESKETLSATQQLQGVEVLEGTYSLKTLTSNPLAGVLVGALLTFLATYLNDRRQRRKERVDKRRWLTDTLPAQLQGAGEAVAKELKTDFDPLTSKLSTEGYLAELRRLDKSGLDLVTRLMSLSQEMHDYEKLRSERRLGDAPRDTLSQKLNQLATELRRLG